MSINHPSSERRAFGRRQTHDHAIVRVTGRPPLRCLVKNISDGGALLEFSEPVWLPFTFRLIWEASKREEDCETKHQNGTRIGVSFAERAAQGIRHDMLTSKDVAPWIAENAPVRR